MWLISLCYFVMNFLSNFSLYDQNIITDWNSWVSRERFKVPGIPFYAKHFPVCLSFRNFFCEYNRLFSDQTDPWTIRKELIVQLRLEDVPYGWILRRLFNLLFSKVNNFFRKAFRLLYNQSTLQSAPALHQGFWL